MMDLGINAYFSRTCILAKHVLSQTNLSAEIGSNKSLGINEKQKAAFFEYFHCQSRSTHTNLEVTCSPIFGKIKYQK